MKMAARFLHRRPHCLLAMALMLTSCASGQQDRTSHSKVYRQSEDGTCTLSVENHGWTDLHLYALRPDGTRVPLGTVGSLDERRVRLSKTLMAAGVIQLVAVPAVLGEAFVTNHLMLAEGTTVHWHLKNHLALSTLVVR